VGRSVYTTLQKCKAVERLELPERTLDGKRGAGISRRPGVDGYSIYVIDDDPRSWVVLERNKHLASLERQMVSDFKLGYFPNVASAKVAEWRLNASGKAVGLILRVFYQRADVCANSRTARAAAFLTFDVRDEENPVLLGSGANNSGARDLLKELELCPERIL